MPYVATDSKPLILGLSNEVSFVSELSLKGGQTTQNTFPKICCTKILVHQCSALKMYFTCVKGSQFHR